MMTNGCVKLEFDKSLYTKNEDSQPIFLRIIYYIFILLLKIYFCIYRLNYFLSKTYHRYTYFIIIKTITLFHIASFY